MVKPVIHISEADAASDFGSLMARVREGTKIIIEHESKPIAVLHSTDPVRRRVSECIALAKAHEETTGEIPVLDADFAKDVEEIIKNHKPWIPRT